MTKKIVNSAKDEILDNAVEALASPMTNILGKFATPTIFLGNKLGDCINKGIDKGFDMIFGSKEKNK